MSRKYAGLVLAVVLADAILAALLLWRGWAGLRIAVAVPFALVLPGGALTFALFPAGRLGRAERLLLALGLSLAVVVLGGLALHLTPWGLRAGSWAALLGLIVAAAGGIGAARRRRGPARAAAPGGGGLSPAQVVLCGLAALTLAGALTLTVRGAQGQATVGFTQLWMVPATDGAAVTIGLSNREPGATGFRVQFEVDGRVRRTWSPTLAPAETWTEAVPLPGDLAADAQLEAVLYRADSPGVVYRRVELQRGER